MGDQELGMKAQGVCLTPLLECGVPANQTVNTILKEIDTHLFENQTRIEECVKELMEMSQTLSGIPQKFMHPADALIHITENRLLDKEMCFDPDSDAVVKLLRSVLHIIEKNPGCEEKVLNQLLEISASEGMALPFKSTGDPTSQSVVSINAAIDSSAHATDKLWNDICIKMKKYYSNELKTLQVGETRPTICWNDNRALKCVQALSSLIPSDKVWTLYNNIRSQQLDACIKKYVPNLGVKSKKAATLADVPKQFGNLTRCVLIMMDHDFEMLNSGVFNHVVTPIAALTEIYLERLTEEVGKIVDHVMEDLGNNPAGRSPKKDHRRRTKDKEMSKSPSDMGFLGHLKVGVNKPQSKSADNLLTQDEDQQFSDLQVMPSGYVEPLTQLVSDFLQLESHLDSLHSAMVWESMANAGTKVKPKQGLKSALKSSHKLEDIKKSAFSPRSFENSGLLPDAIPAPYGASQAMIAQLSASLKVVEKPFDDHISWPWRLSFNKLASDLAKSVEYLIHVQADCSLRELEDCLEAGKGPVLKDVPSKLTGGRLDYPRRVSQSVLSLMTELDRLLPLAMAGPDSPFDMVRAAFIDATIISLKNISLKLTKLCSEVGKKLPQKCLYSSLSSLAYVRNHLLYYEKSLGTDDGNSKRAFPSLYRQYCDSVDKLSSQIIERHNSLIVTSILQDAESHQWEDSKEFYEGERCSFAIQMWHLHMHSLRSALWGVCPPKLSQTMFASVLQESLSVLCQRYVRVKPSYKRTSQFRTDITAILLCTSELLFYTTDTTSHYLDPTNAHTEHFSIHTSCCMLLAAMTVVSAPIDMLYKVYKKGFKKKRSHSDEDSTKGYVSHWLAWLRPQLLPLGKTRTDDIQTTSALYLNMRLLSSKSAINWTLLLQCLLMKDFTLPIMLLTHLALQQGKDAKNHRADSVQDETTSSSKKHAGKPARKETESGLSKEIFHVFMKSLLQCGEFPTAFAKVLLPVFERSDTWRIFDSKVILSEADQVPPWLSAVFHCLESYIIRSIDPGVRVLLTRHNEPVGTEPIALRLKELPCGCPTSRDTQNPLGNKVLSNTSEVVTYVMQENPNLSGSKDVLSEALYSVVTQLVGDVTTLPTPLLTFFNAAQKHVSQKGIQTPHNCVGIKILAMCLKLKLGDISYIESLVGEPLPDAVKENMALLAECVYHVLTASSFAKGSGAPKAAGMFIKANRNWVSDQVEVLEDHFSNEIFDLTDHHPLDDTTVEFSEYMLMSQASSVLSLDNGEENLHRIYNFLLNNESWILAQLDIPPLLEIQAPHAVGSLTLSLKPPHQKAFNPLHAFANLGDAKFNHSAVVEFPWDWSALLYSDLGLSEVGFRTLLFNRHEMQDGAYLEEQEKKPVESLRKRFHADSPEL